MAASDSCTIMNKQVLENALLYVYYTKDESQTASVCVKVKIEKFSKLNYNVPYTKILSYKDWILNVLKKRKSVILTLRNLRGCTYVIMCYIGYDKFTLTSPVYANKASDGEYVIELSSEKIHDPQNAFLGNDILVFELDIASRITSGTIRPVLETTHLRKDDSILCVNEYEEPSEEECLMKDLRKMMYVEDWDDFQIKIKGYSENVNKSIIAARSKFLFDYLKANPDAEEIELDTSLKALKLTVQYIYYGTFYSESISTMLEVIELAKKLQMKGLYEICVNYVKNSIDADNAQLIKEMGSKSGEDALVSAAEKFLSTN